MADSYFQRIYTAEQSIDEVSHLLNFTSCSVLVSVLCSPFIHSKLTCRVRYNIEVQVYVSNVGGLGAFGQ